MTAVAVPVARGTEVLQWLTPAPLWDKAPLGSGASGVTRPWIAEIADDQFVDAFTGILGGADPAVALAATEPAVTADGTATGPFRLFQPLSMRHYLVTATLVCKRPGIPDHTVRVADGERAFFVLRRLSGDHEEGFLPGAASTPGTWVAADPQVLVPGEQEHPMHPTPVRPYAESATAAGSLGLARTGGPGRQVWFGYVPVGIQQTLLQPMADPAKALADLQATMPANKREDPTLDALYVRVIRPWQHLDQDSATPPNVAYASLFILLDLGDWLRTHLNDVHTAVKNGSDLSGAKQVLLTSIRGTSVTLASGGSVTLAQALIDTEQHLDLLTGKDEAVPGAQYNLRGGVPVGWLGSPPGGGVLASQSADALAQDRKPAKVPPELEGMILERPPASSSTGSAGAGPTYVIRTVLVHEPCQPVLSAPTRPFELARPMDADAPARKILLQMPDIRRMRGFQRGVAIEMPPALRRIMDRITPDTMKGELDDSPGLDLGMVCAFSLQIIFLVAFIVMFIFLIVLNIVFWWLPFLKICFPVPVPESPSQGPTP